MFGRITTGVRRAVAVPAIWAMAAMLRGAPVPAGEVVVMLDERPTTSTWGFSLGPEFPGAVGRVEDAAGGTTGLRVTYDFTRGGAYVSLNRRQALPDGTTAVTVEVLTEAACTVGCRFANPGGRTFQAVPQTVDPGGPRALTFRLDGPWESAWGGTEDEALAPGARLSILFQVRGDAPKQNTVTVSQVRGLIAAESRIGFETQPVDAVLAGWHLRGTWLADYPVGSFMGTAVPVAGVDGELSIAFPRMGRDDVVRLPLVAADGERSLRYGIPASVQPNPRNVYRVRFSVESGQGRGGCASTLRGSLAGRADLTLRKNSREIGTLPFGTCVHFSYGRNGAFRGWAATEELLDEAAACGLKWIRDGVTVKRRDDGEYGVDPADLAWIRAARERGIDTILVLWMEAKEPLDDLRKRAAAVAAQTRDLVRVYELGNEPNNFGGWIDTYGGTWNGKEADNATSPWVREHLKATNAAAEAVRDVAPEATIIGLGACTPTNFRYLDLGLSPLVTGVVDHPYAYSLPPELVPYGSKLAERDGVEVGDDRNSFTGLVESYLRKFRETGTDRTLWVTEFGYTTFRFDGTNHKGLYAGYTERAQAIYLVRRFLLSLSLPIAVTCQYDLLDDYGSDPSEAEANFGLLRADRSRKPAFHALQRLNSLVADHRLDETAAVTVETAELHRAQVRGALVADWDKASIEAANGVVCVPLVNPAAPGVRRLALWSARPVDTEFGGRAVTLRIGGWPEFSKPPVAIDLVSGECFDVPLRLDGSELVLDNVQLDDAPLILQFTRD